MVATPVSIVLLGFFLGMRHATDPDHLVAVATIVTRERRFTDGALVGVLWGAGHMTTLTIVGALIIGLATEISAAYITPSYKDVIAFAVLLIMMVVRPGGLLGAAVS